MNEDQLFSNEPDSRVVDHTGELAKTLGLSDLAFADLFGANWRAAPGPQWHDYDSDPSGGEGIPATPWMLAGDPPHLMVRVFHHGVFLAVPEGDWSGGSHGLIYRPGEERYLSKREFEHATAHVAQMLCIRREEFRYCRYCREHTPPELRRQDDVCMGCATAWRGLVY